MNTIIVIAIVMCAILLVILLGVLFYIMKQEKESKGEENGGGSSGEKGKESSARLQGISMTKFLDFDRVVDSMIVRKNGSQYVMVIQCRGINYDLLGEEEKIAVENGFSQFLNTLRYPIQLYIQTRSINLKDSIDQYEARVEEVRSDIAKIEAQIKREKANGREELVAKHEFDLRRKKNILEYGEDITSYISKMSQNRNVLQQNTYVVVAYNTAEFGGEIANYSREEVDNIAFSELYIRAQSLIRGLSSSGVAGRVLDSEELTELLYIAYNRDDSELISVQKAVNSEYDCLYHTAKDVFEKHKQVLQEKYDKEAVDIAASSIYKADEVLKMKKNRKEIIRKRAIEYVEQYKDDMTDELYEETKRQVEIADIEDEEKAGTKKSRVEEAKRKRQGITVNNSEKGSMNKKTDNKDGQEAKGKKVELSEEKKAELLKKRKAELLEKKKEEALKKKRAEALAKKKAEALVKKKAENISSSDSSVVEKRKKVTESKRKEILT